MFAKIMDIQEKSKKDRRKYAAVFFFILNMWGDYKERTRRTARP